MARSLPVVDLSNATEEWDRVVKDVGDACQKYGFFYVVNHGIDSKLISDLFSLGFSFFGQTPEEKNKIAMKYAGKAFRGYFNLGGELTSNKPDWKEGLYFGAEIPKDHPDNSKPMHGQNLWPANMPELEKVVLGYMEALTKLGHLLMEAIGRSLGLSSSFFREKFTSEPFIPFRLFYYPADKTGVHEDGTVRWGVGKHTDYGVLTILAQDSVGGLEVQSVDGDWIVAPPIDGSFVVNIGDMLEIWTGGRYKSTPHRVKNTTTADRLSAPFFFDPPFDCIIHPEINEQTDLNSPWAKPFPYGQYIHNKVLHNFPELAEQTETPFYDTPTK